MKLLETKEGIKAFYLYNDEEVYVYEDKVVIGDKNLPVNENECVEYKNGVLFKTITDKDDDIIIDRRVAASVVSPLISAVRGVSLRMKSSFLLDKVGEKIGSDKLTIVNMFFQASL